MPNTHAHDITHRHKNNFMLTNPVEEYLNSSCEVETQQEDRVLSICLNTARSQ